MQFISCGGPDNHDHSPSPRTRVNRGYFWSDGGDTAPPCPVEVVDKCSNIEDTYEYDEKPELTASSHVFRSPSSLSLRLISMASQPETFLLAPSAKEAMHRDSLLSRRQELNQNSFPGSFAPSLTLTRESTTETEDAQSRPQSRRAASELDKFGILKLCLLVYVCCFLPFFLPFFIPFFLIFFCLFNVFVLPWISCAGFFFWLFSRWDVFSGARVALRKCRPYVAIVRSTLEKLRRELSVDHVD